MFDLQDLLQWDRFITPTIIKTFYWLLIALAVAFGLMGILSSLALMAVNPFSGFIGIIVSLLGVITGVVASRIVTEFILIVFRMNEHLGKLAEQGFTPPSDARPPNQYGSAAYDRWQTDN